MTDKTKLVYWDDEHVFHADESLFGLTCEELEKKLGMELGEPVEWPYWGNQLDWQYSDDLGEGAAIFMFQYGKCVIIYGETDGRLSRSLEESATKQFGETDEAFVNGGLCRYYLFDNEFDDTHHVQQRYVHYTYKEW